MTTLNMKLFNYSTRMHYVLSPSNAKNVLTFVAKNALAKFWHDCAAILKIQRKSIEIENIYTFFELALWSRADSALLGFLSHFIIKLIRY